MRILEVLRKIGLLTKSKEELDDYYISKEIVKKYRKEGRFDPDPSDPKGGSNGS